MKRSEKLTLIAIAMGVLCGISLWHWGVSVYFAIFSGIFFSAIFNKGLMESAAATSIVDSNKINEEN